VRLLTTLLVATKQSIVLKHFKYGWYRIYSHDWQTLTKDWMSTFNC